MRRSTGLLVRRSITVLSLTVWSSMLRPPARVRIVPRLVSGRFFDVHCRFLGADRVVPVVHEIADQVLLVVGVDALVGLDDPLGARLLELLGFAAFELFAELVFCACHGFVLPRAWPLLRTLGRMSGFDVPRLLEAERLGVAFLLGRDRLEEVADVIAQVDAREYAADEDVAHAVEN